MPPQDKNLAKLESLIKLLDEQVTKEDFTKAFEQVLNLVVQIEKRTVDAIAQLEKTYATLTDKMQSNHASAYSDLKGQVDHVFVGDKMNEMRKEHTAKMAEIDKKIAGVKDGKTPQREEIISLIKPLIPKPIEGKAGKTERLTEVLARLDELEKEMKKQKGRNYVVGGSAGGGRIVKIYSLSSQLNGVLKTFSLPAFWRVLNVHSASFPYSAFEPTTDWTSDSAAMTITFTDAIDASTELAIGQTLLIEYAEI